MPDYSLMQHFHIPIVYRNDHEIDLDQLTALFNSVGWERRTADRDRLAQLVRGSLYVISAWEGERLVGFARAISDGAFNAYISTVAVLPEYQKRGIGRELIQRLSDGRDHLQFVLHANERAYPFYLHLNLGFEPFENV
ncbi:MAG TPA: GNAT family N-acetyltransferase, partial [Anaerolineae bacterium]|nr:GNAT family N-acetyltransferase [Anaerolineae bacterium]